VKAAFNEKDVTKVRIYRHKDARLTLGLLKKGSIAWVWTELTRFDNIMATNAKPFRQATARTTVDQELQRPTARTRSI
jgi:hypothetical protein